MRCFGILGNARSEIINDEFLLIFIYFISFSIMDLGLKKIVVGVFVKSESNEILMVQEAKDEVK
jgi:hypothetical protein